jgi:PAS domain S-box-containing protein
MGQRKHRADFSRLTRLLRHHRGEILDAWQQAFRRLPIACDLDQPALRDHVPGFLDRIVEIAEALEAGRTPELPLEAAGEHAVGRLGHGFDLGEVVTELTLLRDTIITRLRDTRSDSVRLPELRILNQAIDKAVTASVVRYTEARDRVLKEFDESVRVAIEGPDLDVVLDNLVHVLLDKTPDAEAAAILLREGDVLRVRAAAGIETDSSFAPRVGEGFAGTVTAERRPIALSSASTDPLVADPALRAAGVRALYGAPLFDGGDVIGVIQVGSVTANKFTPQDHHLVEVIAFRAQAAIHQLMLRETAEQVSAKLRESENQLRTIANTIPQLAWMTDGAGAAIWANDRWLDFTGLTLEAASGSGWQQVQHPEHLKRVVERFAQAVASGEAWEDTFPMRGKSGNYRWFLSRAVPIRDGEGHVVHWFGTNTDVTEHRFLAEATKLLGASLDYHDTLEKLARLAVPDIADWCVVHVVESAGPRRIAVAHADPAKTELARAWARTSPPAWSEPGGIARVIRTGEPELVAEISDEFLVGISRTPEQLEALREQGLVSYIAVPLIARDRTLGALTLVTAESKRRLQPSDVGLAMELGRLAGVAIDNARLYGEAQDAVELRERILAIVSHDLRGPLSAIDLSASLIQESHLDDPETRKKLGIISRSTTRMQRMIGDLLDLARIQSGTLTLERRAHEAAEVLSASLESFELLARQKSITIVVDSDLGALRVSCDRERIEQVFANLLDNALKYCQTGDTITVRGTREGDRVRCEVEDTGPGIPADVFPHIFEPYWSARDHAKEGLGLGLYICKAIVDAHGGELWAESRPGRGALFVVRLPILAS